MAFTFKLEHEDGTPADPPVLAHGRAELAAMERELRASGRSVRQSAFS